MLAKKRSDAADSSTVCSPRFDLLGLLVISIPAMADMFRTKLAYGQCLQERTLTISLYRQPSVLVFASEIRPLPIELRYDER